MKTKITGGNQYLILEALELAYSSSGLPRERTEQIEQAACSPEIEAEIGFTERCSGLDSRISNNQPIFKMGSS